MVNIGTSLFRRAARIALLLRIVSGVYVLCCILPIISKAQEKDIKFHHITVDDGLPSNTVNSVIRDSRGFIWIASENGVSRYDGYTFSNFRSNEEDEFSISSNIAYAVFEDKQDRLWVGSVNGLDLLNRSMDRFDKHFFKGIPVRAIYQDTRGNVWIGTDGGLYLYQEETGKFIRPFDNLFAKHDQYNTIPSITEDQKGNLWIGTSRNGVYVYNFNDKSFKEFRKDDTQPGSLSDNNIRCIIKDHRQRMWVSTYGGGINLYQPETGTFKTYVNDADDPSSLSNNLTNVIWEDNDGKLWIGTDGNGLDIFDPTTDFFYHVVHSPYNSKSLNNSVVRSISTDGRGGIWVGTYAGGVNFFDQNTEAFFHYKVPTFNGNNSVTSFAEEKNGNLWIGTDGGGLCYFNRVTGQFSNFYHNKKNRNSISDNRIISLLLDHKGFLWIGTYLGGLCKYDTKTRTFYRYEYRDRSMLSDNVIWTLLEDNQNRIWAGTNNGLNLYDPVKDNFTNIDITNSNLSNSMVRSMYEDDNGRLWIGTQQGINLLKSNNSFDVIKCDHNKSNGLSNDWIRTINQDLQGNIWIGTFEGLNLFDEASNTFHVFKETDGLPDNTVSGIIGDHRNNIWISTGRGLAWLDMKTKTIKNYYVNDGLQDNQFNINAFFKTQKGEFLFGGINGFSLFVPDVIKHTENNGFPPPLALTSFKIFNKEILPQVQGSPLHKHINETDQINLSYDQSVLTFEFSALNFIQPENNHYAYRLKGFENEWNYIEGKRSATYTNLEPGSYTFQVKASNNDGVWNEKGISIDLNIAPPFWDTWWFKTIIAMLCMTVALYIFDLVKIRIREKIRINKIIAELEIKALIAQMNPHFIFNCLTSIQELIMVNKPQDAMHYLNQFSRLLRTVLQTSEKNYISLEQELILLELYLELEAMRFDKQFHYKIEVEPIIDPEEITIPSFLLQPFVENALWHGLMHKKGDRNLTISFKLETEDLLLCKIEDNGIGREHASIIKKKSLKSYQSMGIKIIGERIELMKKQNGAFDLQIIDKVDDDGVAKGTTVIIKLPIDNLYQDKTPEISQESNYKKERKKKVTENLFT
jgi:ligand-binding sensor domain-containing protein